MTNIFVVILAAGKGKRMYSPKAKVMHTIAGTALITHVIQLSKKIKAKKIITVIGEKMEEVQKEITPTPFVVQKRQLGTAHALLAAKHKLRDSNALLLVIYGDSPLVDIETINKMLKKIKVSKTNLCLLGFKSEDCGHHGRIKCNKNGNVQQIIEFADANNQEKKIKYCNSGIILGKTKTIINLASKVNNKNKKREYYLTDIVKIAKKQNIKCSVVFGEKNLLLGINNKKELAMAETILQKRLKDSFMDQGVTFLDPDSVYLSSDVKFGKNVVVEPNVFIGKSVKVGNNVLIRSFSHIEESSIGNDSKVGPYARLRPGTKISSNTSIGNFVEIKNSSVGAGTKINHLTYIGDSTIGKNVNIGAGTITCNYDGRKKHKTIIHDEVFVGSNVTLVAPVTVGKKAYVAAGSVITDSIKTNALAIGRQRQIQKSNYFFKKSKK